MSEQFGIDLSKLEMPVTSTPVMLGRVASLDGDGLCYLAAAVTDDESFAACKNAFDSILSNRVKQCGAAHSRIHLTGGDKGNRYEIAKVKEYQANRQGKDKPKHLDTLRSWVQSKYVQGDHICIMNEHQEADDGMAQDNYAAIKRGMPHLSIIHSLDKDLKMCSGLHCDWNTYEIVEVYGFGSIHLDESGSVKKVKGYGTAFFWAQMLMGDTADNIPGLPSAKGKHLMKLAPATVLKAMQQVESGLMPSGKPMTAMQMDKALAKVTDFHTKGKPLGAVATYEILKDCKTDLHAMGVVVGLYREYYGSKPFKYEAWNGWTHLITAGDMAVEQARLLWMRREVDECPTTFMASVVQGKAWHE